MTPNTTPPPPPPPPPTPLTRSEVAAAKKEGLVGFGEDLQKDVMRICPAWSHKVTDWRNMEALSSRVSGKCFELIDQTCAELNIPKKLIPQKWFCDVLFLQKPLTRVKNSTEHLTAAEQEVVTARLLYVVAEVWKARRAEGGFGFRCAQKLAEHSMNRDDFKKIIRLAKKFTQGMLEQVGQTGISLDDCLDVFVSGECDGRRNSWKAGWRRFLLSRVLAWSVLPVVFGPK